VLDPNGRLDISFNVFNEDGQSVYYFSAIDNPAIEGSNISKHILNYDADMLTQILEILFQHQIGILLVEGGSYVQKQFIKQNLWDEAWVIQSQHDLAQGIAAPDVMGRLIERIYSGSDIIIGIAQTREMQYAS
jgi:diaminohydroxyphosphoribosylaminopyrimidine deaminase/5-amino-6-(5-phosphoribosylamino)uracil reductase